MILKGSGVARDMEPETLLSLLSHYKSHDKKVGDLPERTSTEKEIKRVLIQYEKWKSEQNYMDFDDILELSLDLLQQDETILQQMRARFTHILCDEFQDTNPVQYELIKLLAEPTKNLFVVGDDDQTIYSFNGANQEHLLNFHRDFPGCNVKKLTINYRSSNHILTLGNEIIQNNTYRHQKKLKAIREAVEKPLFLRPDTTDEEAEWVLDQIRSDVKLKGKNTVILPSFIEQQVIVAPCLNNLY
nr:ATP-dependent helicase [Bacillus coahuilensis]